jgi:hypothetical protein
MKTYAGIGSRETPDNILQKMNKIAIYLARGGWTLRSGGANGADLAFESGCDVVNGGKEIFLPWPNFNGSTSTLCSPTKDAFIKAATMHPVWEKLSYGARKLHARNIHQILGLKLNDPANLVICWTKDGKEVGGTATAIKIAKEYNIKIVNLALEEFLYEQI